MSIKKFLSKKSGKMVTALVVAGVTGREYFLTFDLGTICDISGLSPLDIANLEEGYTLIN